MIDIEIIKKELEKILKYIESNLKEINDRILDNSVPNEEKSHLKIIKIFLIQIRENISMKYTFLLENEPQSFDPEIYDKCLTFYEEYRKIW